MTLSDVKNCQSVLTAGNVSFEIQSNFRRVYSGDRDFAVIF
jgi:hypothetical protein